MKRFLLSTAIAVISQATVAMATDLGNMNDSEREAFRAEVRAYILDNPGIIMEAVAVLEERKAADQVNNDKELLKANADDIYNDGASFVGGNLDGDITIVDFSDYHCPYCKKAHAEIQALIKADGNIRIIYKEFPILGPDSVTAAKFALATLLLAPNSYEDVNTSLMAMRGKPNEAALTSLAKGLGLDAAAILEKMDSDAVNAIIENNRSLGGRLQITGTPTFILADQLIRGYVPLQAMQQIVEEARKQ